MEKKPCCPTCSLELDPRHGAGELRLASPLAWRVLGRIKLRCPLEGGPSWSEMVPNLGEDVAPSHMRSPERSPGRFEAW